MKKTNLVTVIGSVLLASFFAVGCASTPTETTTTTTEEPSQTEEVPQEVVEQRQEVPQSLQGIWYDEKYNCNWVFKVNASDEPICDLRDASSNRLIYKFTKENVQNFALTPSRDAVTITFDCSAKNRNYKFARQVAGTSDIDLDIYNSKYNTRHTATIVYKGALVE